MLSGTRFGDDAVLAHPPGQQDLSDGIVDLVGSGVVEVLAFQIDACSVSVGEFLRKIQGRGPSDVIPHQGVELLLESRFLDGTKVFPLEGFDVGTEHLRYVSSAEGAVIALVVYIVSHGIFCLGRWQM